MRSGRLALLAVFVVVTAAVWSVALLRVDVVPRGAPDEVSCGSRYGALQGRPSHGGELPYPDDWTSQCRAVARDGLAWVGVPAVGGTLAVEYLLIAWVGVVRRSRPVSGSERVRS